MNLIVKRIATCAGTQPEIALTHQSCIIVIILFYHVQDKVTVSVTYTPISASRPRRLRMCPGERLHVTLIGRKIAAYA